MTAFEGYLLFPGRHPVSRRMGTMGIRVVRRTSALQHKPGPTRWRQLGSGSKRLVFITQCAFIEVLSVVGMKLNGPASPQWPPASSNHSRQNEIETFQPMTVVLVKLIIHMDIIKQPYSCSVARVSFVAGFVSDDPDIRGPRHGLPVAGWRYPDAPRPRLKFLMVWIERFDLENSREENMFPVLC